MSDFEDQLSSVLDNYASDLRDAINADTEAAAQKLKKAIQADAPVRTGESKKSWTITREKVVGIDLKCIVHSKEPHYRIVHLLENGHLTRNGVTRTKPTYYVSRNADRIIDEYQAILAETIKVVK